MKKCTKCNIDKHLPDFSKNSYAKDGYRNVCKKCISEQTIKSGYKRRNNKKLPVRYRYAKNESKRKGHVWDIDVLEYEVLLKKPCTYCGGPLAETGIGLDRIDSDLDYTIDNVNPCCRTCNIMKNALSLEAFSAHILKINEYLNLKKRVGR